MRGDEFFGGIFVGFLISTIFWIGAYSTICDPMWREKCVKSGAAQYNSENGNFEWKEPVGSK
jgi:hypothetical protein